MRLDVKIIGTALAGTVLFLACLTFATGKTSHQVAASAQSQQLFTITAASSLGRKYSD
jgi:hypothetical protein